MKMVLHQGCGNGNSSLDLGTATQRHHIQMKMNPLLPSSARTSPETISRVCKEMEEWQHFIGKKMLSIISAFVSQRKDKYSMGYSEFLAAVKINVTYYQDGLVHQRIILWVKKQRVSYYLLTCKNRYKYYVLLMDTFPGSKCLKSCMGMMPTLSDRGKGFI